jgi:hypothetical protein
VQLPNPFAPVHGSSFLGSLLGIECAPRHQSIIAEQVMSGD